MAETVSIWNRGRWVVAPDVRDLKRARSVPGGCTQASFTIPDDGLMQPLGADCKVVISTGGSGRIVWDGYVEAPPVPNDGRLQVSCVGSANYDLQRDYWRMPYLVTAYNSFKVSGLASSKPGSTVEAGVIPSTTASQSILLKMPPGSFTTWDRVMATFTGYEGSGFAFGAFHGVTVSGTALAGWNSRIYVGDPGFAETPWNVQTTSSQRTVDFRAGDANAPRGQNLLSLEMQWNGTTAMASDDDKFWTAWWSTRVYSTLYDRFANEKQPSSLSPLDPSWIFEDAIARFLPGLASPDPARSVIETSSFPIWSLDLGGDGPVSVAELFSTISTVAPGWYWAYDPAGADGQHALRWRPWPTEAGLMIPADAEWTDSGTESGLKNKVIVLWNDPATSRKFRIDLFASADKYPDLEYVQGTDALEPLDLGSNVGSGATALAIGNAVLKEVATYPRAGTVKITEPILDPSSGLMLEPGEIEPGVQARMSDDGSLLRVTAVDYDDETGTATVTLAQARRTVEEIIATSKRAPGIFRH